MGDTHLSFWEVFRALVDFALRPERRVDLDRASQEYFGTARPLQANASGDGGIEGFTFLEWMIFDRPRTVGRNAIIEAFLDSNMALRGNDREEVLGWADAHLSFYEVTDVVPRGVFLRDLTRSSGEIEHFVADPPPSMQLRGHELVMARLLKWNGELHLAGAVNVFPENARSSLCEFLREVRDALTAQDWADVLRDVLPALSRLQTIASIEEEPLFPGGYPEHLSNGTVETLVDHGKSCMERGEWTEALLCFQRALYAEPLHVAARSGVGLVYLNQGDIEQARRAFESILATHPGDPIALLNLGNVAIVSGRLDEARMQLRLAKQAATDDVVRTHASFNLGLVSLALDEPANAVRFFHEASRLVDTLPSPIDAAGLLFRIGSNLAASQRFNDALTFFRKSVRYAPDFGEGRLHLADSYAKLDRFRDAAREYRNALRLGAGGGRTWLALGHCYRKLEQWPRAESAFLQAVELLPGLVEAHVELAQAMIAQDRLQEARHRCEVVLGHAPQSVDILVMVGEVARRLGDYTASSRYLRRALRLEPLHVEARGLLAQVRREGREACT